VALLCDIGNSFAHFYDGVRSWREPHNRLELYRRERVCYINVKTALEEELRTFEGWTDLEPFMEIETDYRGLGADRKALCLAVEDGVVVDAGSAVTVDLMEKGRHKGGFIYPGITKMRECYGTISPILKGEMVPVRAQRLPQRTDEAVSYGILIPLVKAIESLGSPIYVTGGDGRLLADLITDGMYDGLLIFKGLEKVKERVC